MWNAVSGEEELNLQHRHIVKSVNFSDDSVNLATGSNDKVIRIFDLEKSNDGPKVRHDKLHLKCILAHRCTVVGNPGGGSLGFLANSFEGGTWGCEKVRGGAFLCGSFQKSF